MNFIFIVFSYFICFYIGLRVGLKVQEKETVDFIIGAVRSGCADAVKMKEFIKTFKNKR